MNQKRGTKGISPLIATVILIGFVVAIAALVFFWGRSYIVETAQKEGELSRIKLQCSEVTFDVVSFDAQGLTLENKGSIPIAGFKLRAGNTVKDMRPGLQAYEQKVFNLANDVVGGGFTATTFDLIPLLKPEGRGAQFIPCSDKLKKISG